MRMDPQRAAKLGVDPTEIQITCEAHKFANRWILWIPNARYTEEDPRHKQILTEGRIHELCYWKQDLTRYAHGA